MSCPINDDKYNCAKKYSRKDEEATGWFVGIIVALALLSIGYLIFS